MERLPTLWCFARETGGGPPFQVNIHEAMTVSQLKQTIKTEMAPLFDTVTYNNLVLYKVMTLIPLLPDDLDHRITALEKQYGFGPLVLSKLSQFNDSVKTHFNLGELDDDTLHIIVQKPDDEPPQKRRKIAGDKSLTPDDSPRMGLVETKQALEDACAPFTQYIKHLADGRLDGHFTSKCRSGKFCVPGFTMTTDPNLLIHNMGVSVDQQKIRELFCNNTVHLFNTSGSGKTRLLLDGLCHCWGIYFTCRAEFPSGGSKDLRDASNTLPKFQSWGGAGDVRAKAAKRALSMLVCSRIFLFKKFVEALPEGITAVAARKRWTFLQVVPPLISYLDLFVLLFRSLRHGDEFEMNTYVETTLTEITSNHPHLFQDDLGSLSNFKLWAVLDEAQAASTMHQGIFPSTSDPSTLKHSFLHEAHLYLMNSDLFSGIVLSGTGLSVEAVNEAIRSSYAKEMPSIGLSKVFTDTGSFMDADIHKKYILGYLDMDLNNYSHQRLLERMVYWLRGRYRPTAGLISIFLSEDNLPRHRILSAYIHQLTKFTPIDAVELEEQEDHIPPKIHMQIKKLIKIGSLEPIFEDVNSNSLVQTLVHIVRRWMMAGELSHITRDDEMHKLIDLGVGQLRTLEGTRKDNISQNFSVYIGEPLIILYLSTRFQEQGWTTRWECFSHAILSAPSRPAIGFLFEEVIMYLLMDVFGGKSIPLEKVFHFPEGSPLGGRNVELVAGRQVGLDSMSVAKTSWLTGSSDGFGFKAKSTADALAFLRDPKGKPFLFPDNYMGPDLLCLLRDTESEELMVLLVQAKVQKQLDTKTWMKALESINPEYFYTYVNKDSGKRVQHGSIAYEDLLDNLNLLFTSITGTDEFRLAVEGMRSRLRSARQPSGTRKTPKFLRVVASPDDKHGNRLDSQRQGDVATLKWDAVVEYIGRGAANQIKEGTLSIHL